MIGVIPREGQTQVVTEFFELFKTPWELFKSGRRYEVVIATADVLPEIDAKVVFAYGAESKNVDSAHRFVIGSRPSGAYLPYRKTSLPIYGEFAIFETAAGSVPFVTTSVGPGGLRTVTPAGQVVLRIGYDLFEEVQHLLSKGQPREQAHVPTLDLHIELLKYWILNEAIPFLEVSSVPDGYNFTVCLTHDIDFVGIRNHKFDHTMWGFLLRSTAGAAWKFLNGRIALDRLMQCWKAAASLPFVLLGWAKDFWEPFGWYLTEERGLGATYFLIPFKGRSGERVPGRHASRRAAPYEVAELTEWTAALQQQGCELGIHGIDAWHSTEQGRIESEKIARSVNNSPSGVRIHWLLQDDNTPVVLDRTGFTYDSTAGYNETIGYLNGTGQVFRPLGALHLLEIPLHIQDGALFYPQNLNLTDAEAEQRCQVLLSNACQLGGVLTLLWHDRSHAAERFWGDFYIQMIQTLKSFGVWFATCAQAVEWFQARRQVHFDFRGTGDGAVTTVRYQGKAPRHPFKLKIYRPATADGANPGSRDAAVTCAELPWDGEANLAFDASLYRILEARPVSP